MHHWCAVFRLPHCFDSIHDSVKRVEASVMRGFQQRKSAQVTALLMGTHRRLGADSELSTLPEVSSGRSCSLHCSLAQYSSIMWIAAFKLSILMAVTTDFLADMGGC
ncbi:hypothetical protein WJX82_003418 [Trebouxia sp. C0006]